MKYGARTDAPNSMTPRTSTHAPSSLSWKPSTTFTMTNYPTSHTDLAHCCYLMAIPTMLLHIDENFGMRPNSDFHATDEYCAQHRVNYKNLKARHSKSLEDNHYYSHFAGSISRNLEQLLVASTTKLFAHHNEKDKEREISSSL